MREMSRNAILSSMKDPVRDELLRGGNPSLDAVLGLFPKMQGEPAFDPTLIRTNAERLKTFPEVNTGHPFLDRSIKVGLAHIDATFQGDHPKYGVKYYAESRSDAFPPTIIAAVDALSAWGMNGRAAQLFRYWLINFIRNDGTIDFYGPAISEYGQILHTAFVLSQRAGLDGWWKDGAAPLARLSEHLLRLCDAAGGELVAGVPESDIADGDPNNLSDNQHGENNRYFHNNLWLARGLADWASLQESTGISFSRPLQATRSIAGSLAGRTIDAIRQVWPKNESDWWLSPQVESVEKPVSLTSNVMAAYTNYRYWPELLSSGLLPADLAERVVNARLTGGGQFCGMTRFGGVGEARLDDWPLADYLYGLWALGRKDDFLLCLYGHIAYHQAEGHLTAYEQITYPPGKELANYCLPCQLVAARAGRLLHSDIF